MAKSTRLLVGVPGQTLQAMDGIPEGIPHSWVMSHRYFATLAASGLVPVMVPLLAEDELIIRAIFDRLDGVFLAGGVDVNPAEYGQEKGTLCGNIDAARDRVELRLARWAAAEGKPLLGVCRGLHVLNVALGGTLWQDTTAQYPGSIKHDYFPMQGFTRDYLAHDVDVASGSRLAGALGDGAVRVNSMHHQGVHTLAAGLDATAHAPDGLIEAVESRADGFALAVQWHPEALSGASSTALFEAFADACAADNRRSVSRKAARRSR